MTADKVEVDMNAPPYEKPDLSIQRISRTPFVVLFAGIVIACGIVLYGNSDGGLQERMYDCNSILNDAVASSQVGEDVKVKCMHIRWAAYELAEEQKRTRLTDAASRIMNFDLPQ